MTDTLRGFFDEIDASSRSLVVVNRSKPEPVHKGRSYPYRRSWFVVFTPLPAAESARHAALVALEDEPNVWDGFWTFRPELVDRIDRHIATAL